MLLIYSYPGLLLRGGSIPHPLRESSAERRAAAGFCTYVVARPFGEGPTGILEPSPPRVSLQP